MSDRVNLADPDYEPTDEDLQALVREAFAGIAEARRESLRAMHDRIAVARREAREQMAARERTNDAS